MPQQVRKAAPVGRYTSPGREPANGLGCPPERLRTAIGSVPDTDPHDRQRGRRTAVRINLGESILEWELAHGRISQRAYDAGQQMRGAYERLPREPNASNWRGGNSIDPVTARNNKEEAALDAIADVVRIEERARKVIGQSGLNFISRVIRDRYTFSQIAAGAQAKGSRADVSRVADRFRWLLEEMARGWAGERREAS